MLVVRWGAYYLFSETYGSRLPSLFIGLGAVLLAGQIWIVAFLADLLSINRRLASEFLFKQKTDESSFDRNYEKPSNFG